MQDHVTLIMYELHPTIFLFSGSIRGFIADYGVPLLVVVWTLISYAPHASVPNGIPRRLFSPNPWSSEGTSHWAILQVRTDSIYLNDNMHKVTDD